MTTIGGAVDVSGWVLLDPVRALGELAPHAGRMLIELIARHGLILGAGLAVAGASYLMVQERRARRLHHDARQVTILAPPQVEPGGAQALWTNLHDLIRPRWRRLLGDQPHLVFDYTWSVGGLSVGMWVPGVVPPGLVERAIQAAWPGARTTTAPAQPPLPSDGSCTGGRLRLAGPEWLPFRSDHATDPLRALLGAAGTPKQGETAIVQILARPVTGRRIARCHQAARALRTGKSATLTARLLDLLTPGPPSPRQRSGDDPGRAGAIRAILDKAASPGWEIAVRYAVTGPPDDEAGQVRLRGRAHTLACAFALFTGRNRLARHRLTRPATAIARRRLRHGDLASVAELAALAHLPTDVTVPGLARAGAKPVPPAPGVAAVGKVLGDAEVGTRRPVALAPADACFHLHLLGATGSGKSTLLTNLVLQDAQAGRGAVVIDPKGDLIVDLLDRLPAAAASKVVLLDPDDAQAPPSLNMLEGHDADLAVDHVIGIFRRIFVHYWGPRTDDVLRAACLTLLRRPGATLADVPRLLSEPDFRRPYLDGLGDPVGLGGFWAWYESLSQAERAHVIGPAMNKLRAVLLRRFVRDVLGSTTSFDMTEVLDGGLCLIRVPKGVLGDDTARLLGSFLLAKVWQAVTARARTGQSARVDATLYVDECHNFLNLPHSIDDMLAEARGYRLSLVLAHQHLAQLPKDLREALSANARNKLYFAVSPEDARALERHVTPELSAHDLAHLDTYQAAARLVGAGGEQPAFTLRTRPAPPPIPGRAETVRAAARTTYGRTAAQRHAHALARRGGPVESRHTPGGDCTSESAGGSTGEPVGGLRPTNPSARQHAGQRHTGPVDASPDSQEPNL